MTLEDAVFWGSFVGLAVLTFLSYLKNKNILESSFLVALLVVCGVIYAFLYQSGQLIQAKGPRSSDVVLLAVLYAFILAGMFANYCYSLLMKTKRNRRFDWGRFLAPIFVSPFVFSPLLTAFQSADINVANLTLPKFAFFLVAFENGFLWKNFFDKRAAEHNS